MLELAHWSRLGIQQIRDVYSQGTVLEQNILEKLDGMARAHFVFDIAKVRRALTGINGASEEVELAPILDTIYTTKDNRNKKLSDLTFKEILGILSKNKPDHTWTNRVYWSQKLQYAPFDPGKIFSHIFKDAEVPRKPKEFAWKLFYNQISVEKKLKVMRLSDGVCKICRTSEEDLEHMMIGCENLNIIWARILPLIRLTLPGTIVTLDIFYFGLMTEDRTINTLVNTMLGITRWNIWKRRCTYRYDNKLKPVQCCLSTILKEILQHFNILEKQERFKAKASRLRDEIMR